VSTEIKKNSEPSPIAARLEHVRREIAGLKSLSAFHELLTTGDPPPAHDLGSYAAARTWHMGSTYSGEVRHPPLPYLQRILELFPQVRAEWLMRGEGAPTHYEESIRHHKGQAASAETSWQVFSGQMAGKFPGFADLDSSVRQMALEIAADLAVREFEQAHGAETVTDMPTFSARFSDYLGMIADAIYSPLRAMNLPLADAGPTDRIFTRYAKSALLALEVAIGSTKSWAQVHQATRPTNEDARHPGQE
jgi:hypothetical protein